MLFNIEADRGDQIVGYVVPDDYSISPTLRIIQGGAEIAELLCREARPSLVAAGRHATGLCGFTVDSSIVPDLVSNQSLEIREAESGILIYRRRNGSEVTHRRVFRLETHLFPLWRLDEKVEHKFQFFHKGVERHGRETAQQVFMLENVSSLYVSGRLTFAGYSNHIHDKFKTIVLLHDPYLELAERLLTLKHVSRFGDELLGARDMISYQRAIEFAQQIEPDGSGLRRAFDAMPRDVIGVFANPLTRQLSSDSLEEPPPKNGVAKALAALASFSVVGLRDSQDRFLEEVEALLDIEPATLPTLPHFAAVGDLARELRRLPEVELLLEQDLEIYHTAKTAIEEAI
ncbi:hypothetical protein [Methylosinus sporium]|uniref:Uncharacterized protein n=1 Tax=Methylosinus sporium TaxID=428 RepID=A0A2U1SQS8_METSR|nr:hypothetical protein [Methylosinus sporium]PWB93974.1 hypothetical protein C5689_10315 [Methylosinus sporium]